MKPLSFAACLTLALATTAGAQTYEINTAEFVPGVTSNSGTLVTEYMGQTFIAPGSSVVSLDQFTVYGGGVGSLQAFLYAWDVAATQPIGEVQWVSDPLFVNQPFAEAFPFTFTAGVPLVSGQIYALLLARVNATDNVLLSRMVSLLGVTFPTYLDGRMVSGQYGTNLAANIDLATWQNVGFDPNGVDLALTAQFSTVPEPATIGLVAMGLLAIGGAARRCRTRSGAAG